jgi:hypothetical protein
VNGGSIVHEATVSIPLSDLQTRLWLGQIPDWTGYELPAGRQQADHAQPAVRLHGAHHLHRRGARRDARQVVEPRRPGQLQHRAQARPGQQDAGARSTASTTRGRVRGLGLQRRARQDPNFAADGTYIRPGDTGEPILENWASPAPARHHGHLFEVDAYFIRGDWTLFGQVSYGSRRARPSSTATASCATPLVGRVGPGGYKLTPRLEAWCAPTTCSNKKNGGGLLGYSFDDDINGIGRGLVRPRGTATSPRARSVGSNRYALSLGMNYLFDENTTLKARVPLRRRQPAGVLRREERRRYYKSNHLLGASVVVSF